MSWQEVEGSAEQMCDDESKEQGHKTERPIQKISRAYNTTYIVLRYPGKYNIVAQ